MLDIYKVIESNLGTITKDSCPMQSHYHAQKNSVDHVTGLSLYSGLIKLPVSNVLVSCGVPVLLGQSKVNNVDLEHELGQVLHN